jgi:hypothetical protein
MPHEHHAREVQVVGCRLFSEAVQSGADVLIGSGIASTVLVGTPVADAPHGNAAPRQVWAQVTHLLAPGGGNTPATAVDENRDWVWARAVG